MHHGLPFFLKTHRDSFPDNPFSPAVAFALDASVRFVAGGTAAEAAAAFEEASDPTASADSLLGPEAPAVEAVASAVGTALSAPAAA